jgi:hypothetical protein
MELALTPGPSPAVRARGEGIGPNGLPSGCQGGSVSGVGGFWGGYGGAGGCGPWAVTAVLKSKARTAIMLIAKIFAFIVGLLFMV